MPKLSTCLSLALIACWLNGSVLLAQVTPPPGLPDLKPGDELQVYDEGRTKDATFVEFTPVGLIKVRFEDDSRKAFRPALVRFVRAAAKPSAPVVGTPKTVVPSTPAPPAVANAPPAGSSFTIGPLQRTRTWRDASGQFSLDAEFVKLSVGKVELKKKDGSTLSLPLDKLATADRDIAEYFAALDVPSSAASGTTTTQPTTPGFRSVPAGGGPAAPNR
ncbi:SHD1 domain-containing protein [Anatilimnocola sp. NA78]|uniref:SHD1 domain-containing protein n=1 Tax=Anatilimnocola sp. NA78 TaxID=3415683 RepID=UPI003CE48959